MYKLFKILLISFLFLLSTDSIFAGRYYDSETGRWLSVDPLAEIYPGWSPYNYCLNNPLNNIDLNGDSVEVGYVESNPVGDEQHAFLILTNEETGEVTTLEGMPENMVQGVVEGIIGLATGDAGANLLNGVGWGNLVKEEVRSADDVTKENKELVSTPDGMTDSQFQESLITASKNYHGDVKYSPFPSFDKANSNSLIGSYLRSAGSNHEPSSSRNVPGWHQDVFDIKKLFK